MAPNTEKQEVYSFDFLKYYDINYINQELFIVSGISGFRSGITVFLS
jgi:hypothetical protein